MKEIIMTPEQELQQEYPYEMVEYPFEERRRRRSAKEIIKDVLRVVGNVLLGIGKVLLYALLAAVGLAVLGLIVVLIVVFFSKHPEALKILGYVLLGAVCVGALVGLVYGLIWLCKGMKSFCRWLVYGWIRFCRWIKDLKENGEKRRNLMRKIRKVLLYGLLGAVGLVVLGLIVVFFSKHLEALKILGYVLLGAVCVGALIGLVYGLICLYRLLADGLKKFYQWIKDLKENGGRRRRRGPMSREEYRTMLWNERRTYHRPRRHKNYGRDGLSRPCRHRQCQSLVNRIYSAQDWETCKF